MEHAPPRDIALHSPIPETSNAALSISVETLAWAVTVTAAAGLRLAALGSAPFTVSEAARALDAAMVARGDPPDGWTGGLADAAAGYLFRIFGEGEAAARLLPALAGVALVAAIWFLRPYVGRTGALVAGVLVAFSPLLVTMSRSALPFSTGSLLAAVMVVSMFAYIREPRSGPVFVFVAAMTLAPLTDAIAVSTALAIFAFLAIEAGILGNREIGRAWIAFRSNPLQWGSSLLVAGAAVELGLTHFGTSLDKTGLPGLREWAGMFETRRDSRDPEYHLAVLAAYDWPLLAAGAAGFAVLVWRAIRGGASALSLFDRWLLAWTVAAALMIAFTTRREPGQLVTLLLPLALASGALAERLLPAVDWGALRRWWPLPAASLGLAAYALLIMTEWSAGTAAPAERAAMVVAAGGAAFLLIAPFAHMRASAMAALPLTVGVALAAAFLAHSSLAVASPGSGEFASGARLTERAGTFRDTVNRLAEERGGVIVLDQTLRDTLGWTLRNSPVVVGGAPGEATAIIAPADSPPEGFTPLDETWQVAEGWYPESLLRPRNLWRWLLYRQPYYERDSVEVRIYVPSI